MYSDRAIEFASLNLGLAGLLLMMTFKGFILKSASCPYHVRVENGLKIYPWLVDKPGGNVDAENSNRSMTYNRVLRIFEVRTNIIKVG